MTVITRACCKALDAERVCLWTVDTVRKTLHCNYTAVLEPDDDLQAYNDLKHGISRKMNKKSGGVGAGGEGQKEGGGAGNLDIDTGGGGGGVGGGSGGSGGSARKLSAHPAPIISSPAVKVSGLQVQPV
jgi:hypothetical protein